MKGVEALKEHFKNSKFPYDIDEYMPVVFSPPRDGRQLTEPVSVSVTGRFTPTSPPNVRSSSSSSHYSDAGDSPVNVEVLNAQDYNTRNNNNDDDGEDDGDMYSGGGGGGRSRSSSNGGVSGEYDDSDAVE